MGYKHYPYWMIHYMKKIIARFCFSSPLSALGAFVMLIAISFSFTQAYAQQTVEQEMDVVDEMIEELSQSASKPKPNAAATNDADMVPIEYLRQFSDAFARIKKDYVEEVSDQELLENAIHGMMFSLDNFSLYLDGKDYNEFRSDTQGQFGGIGVEIARDSNVLKILSPIDDTPAQRAGILAGDIVTHINGATIESYSEVSPFDALKGKAGTSVLLTIVREGTALPFDVTLRRAVIRVKVVKHETIEPNYGYVRIAQFQQDTAPNVRQALTDLLHKNNNNLKGLVLDLRDNPGGTLGSAIEVSNIFLSEGVIVTVKDRDGNVNGNYEATEPDLLSKTELVVLVNQGSASASEIVAGALKVNKRATIIGETTYGKGSVQTVFPMNFDAALKLTTAKYYLGNGESIHKVGVKPDVVLDRESLIINNELTLSEQKYIVAAMEELKQ